MKHGLYHFEIIYSNYAYREHIKTNFGLPVKPEEIYENLTQKWHLEIALAQNCFSNMHLIFLYLDYTILSEKNKNLQIISGWRAKRKSYVCGR